MKSENTPSSYVKVLEADKKKNDVLYYLPIFFQYQVMNLMKKKRMQRLRKHNSEQFKFSISKYKIKAGNKL